MKHYDLIIAGGGAAGLSAAAHASEQNKQVLVLEAMPKLGGNGVFAEEMFALNSGEAKSRGIHCDVDGWFTLAMEHSHWKNNARLTRNLLERSGANMDWLCENGLNIAGMGESHVEGLGACSHFTQGMHTGHDVMEVLQKFCTARENITILTRARVKELLQDDTGAVTGVTVETEDGPVSFSGDAVILSTGGFGGNAELIRRIIPAVDASAFAHNKGIRMQGDGILMAEAAGAEIMTDGCFENAGPTFPGDPTLMGLVTKRYALWLNKQGRRFANEAVGDNFVYGCNTVYAQPEHCCYVLLDEAMVARALEGPVDFLAGPEAVSRGMAGMKTALEQEAEKGRACVSDDLDEIARFMGADPETLKREIEEYNGFCRQGKDPIFLKPQELLQPVNPGTYVCIRCGVDYILTHGGIRVDENLHVLRADGSRIPNLFAAGVDISGIDANGYQVALAGHSFGLSQTGGRWAADCAIHRR